jgi:hypothetical protein
VGWCIVLVMGWKGRERGRCGKMKCGKMKCGKMKCGMVWVWKFIYPSIHLSIYLIHKRVVVNESKSE